MTTSKHQRYAKNEINIVLDSIGIEKDIISPFLYSGCYTNITDKITLFCIINARGTFTFTIRIQGKKKFTSYDTHNIDVAIRYLKQLLYYGVMINVK